MIEAWHFADACVLDQARRNGGFYKSVSARMPGQLNCWTISSRNRFDLIRDGNGGFTGVGWMSHADKIDIFEAIRKEVKPDAPSRNSCFFAFCSHEEALAAQKSWGSFQGQEPEPIIIQEDSNVFQGDADFYTNAGAYGTLRSAAYRYWLGRTTPNPKLEYLIDGTVFFKNWQSFTSI